MQGQGESEPLYGVSAIYADINDDNFTEPTYGGLVGDHEMYIASADPNAPTYSAFDEPMKRNHSKASVISTWS